MHKVVLDFRYGGEKLWRRGDILSKTMQTCIFPAICIPFHIISSSLKLLSIRVKLLWIFDLPFLLKTPVTEE